MSATLEEPALAVPVRRRHLRRWLVAVVVAVACALLVGWLWTGRHPHLADGYYAQSDTAVPETGSITGESTAVAWFVDASEGTFATVIRNDGRMPFTLVGWDENSGIETSVRFARIVEPYVVFGPPLRSLRVQPGEEVEVITSMLVCGAYMAHGSATTDSVRVTVRTWGIDVVRHLHLPTQYGFYAKSGPLPESDRCVETF